MTVTHITHPAALSRPVRVALVADLHNGEYAAILSALSEFSPDIVAVTGDFLDRRTKTERGFAFLTDCACRYPTLVSLGNHEMKAALDRKSLSARIRETGATLLDNESTRVGELLVGGLSSGYTPSERQGRWRKTPAPDTAFLDAFSAAHGAKLLLCHHPEYFDEYLAPRDTGLVLAGHAHGGQWRFFGRGVFAPGQGLFPRYTSGLYHGRLYVSRGLCKTHRYIPRLFNPRELTLITLVPEA